MNLCITPTQLANSLIQGKYDAVSTSHLLDEIQTVVLGATQSVFIEASLAHNMMIKLSQRKFKVLTISAMISLFFLIITPFIGLWMIWQNRRLKKIQHKIAALAAKPPQQALADSSPLHSNSSSLASNVALASHPSCTNIQPTRFSTEGSDLPPSAALPTLPEGKKITKKKSPPPLNFSYIYNAATFAFEKYLQSHATPAIHDSFRIQVSSKMVREATLCDTQLAIEKWIADLLKSEQIDLDQASRLRNKLHELVPLSLTKMTTPATQLLVEEAACKDPIQKNNPIYDQEVVPVGDCTPATAPQSPQSIPLDSTESLQPSDLQLALEKKIFTSVQSPSALPPTPAISTSTPEPSQLQAFYKFLQSITSPPISEQFDSEMSQVIQAPASELHSFECIKLWVKKAEVESILTPQLASALLHKIELLTTALISTPTLPSPPFWKNYPRQANEKAYTPCLNGFIAMPPLYNSDHTFHPYCNSVYLEYFNAKSPTPLALKHPSTKLNSPSQPLLFCDELHTPDTALFGNDEYSPCGIRVLFDSTLYTFHNAHSAFLAAQVDFLGNKGCIAIEERDEWIKSLTGDLKGSDSYEVGKMIKEQFSKVPHLSLTWSLKEAPILYAITRAKFAQDPLFASILHSQEGAIMIYYSGNQKTSYSIYCEESLNDFFFDSFYGSNLLGNILMTLQALPAIKQAAPLTSLSLSSCKSNAETA